MTPREALGVAGLLFLLAFILSIIMLHRRGRSLSLRVERQQPELYRELGSPLPTTFPSERRMRFDEFIMQRGYEALSDPELVRGFASLRRLETRLLGVAILFLLLLGAALFRLGAG